MHRKKARRQTALVLNIASNSNLLAKRSRLLASSRKYATVIAHDAREGLIRVLQGGFDVVLIGYCFGDDEQQRIGLLLKVFAPTLPIVQLHPGDDEDESRLITVIEKTLQHPDVTP